MPEHIALREATDFAKGHSTAISVEEQGDAPAKNGRLLAKYMGTLADKEDMRALGKVQVLRVCGRVSHRPRGSSANCYIPWTSETSTFFLFLGLGRV